MYYYYQETGGEEAWKACPAQFRGDINAKAHPAFFTVLAVSKLVEDLSYEEKLKLKYQGPFYLDWDGTDIAVVIEKVNLVLDKLAAMQLDLNMVQLFATGGKGFHLEIPEACFMDKIPKDGTVALPTIYREMMFDLYVDTIDLRIYSQGRGRMWRNVNKQRTNGKYKVPVTAAEVRTMTVEQYEQITSQPRSAVLTTPPQLCLDLHLLYAKAVQSVEEKFKKKAKIKPDPLAKSKANSPTIGLMAQGQGIKYGVGFNQIGMQLAIAAVTAGTGIDQFILDCAGIIENHQSDGVRYNTPAKRKAELYRIYQYVDGNPTMEFSIGAIKVLLTHAAPDLDGLKLSTEDVAEGIRDAEAVSEDGESEDAPDEYNDVVLGVILSKYGVYAPDGESGKKRICAVSFANTNLLISTESNEIIAFNTEILINGKSVGRQELEKDVFFTTLNFNKFISKFGHAFTGIDLQLKGVYMRFIEQAKRKGGVKYVAKREGIDVVNIAGHDNSDLHKPFIIWSDNRGVILSPDAQKTGLEMQFVGYPDTKGKFKTDIADAPEFFEWAKDEQNKQALKETMSALFQCQTKEVLGPMIGWYTACFWRMLFHKAYKQFPILHVAGAAGSGKTTLNYAMMSLWYYNNDAISLTPASSPFALSQVLSSSSSIPLFLDEYKIDQMGPARHATMKLMIRDLYNCRDVTKGGGSRENNDYRSLYEVQLSAPMLFIAEAAEDESAVMERVVFLNVIKPPSSVGMKRKVLFDRFERNKKQLAIIGKYIAAMIVNSYSIERLIEEFDAIYNEARIKLMAPTEGEEVTDAERREREGTMERSVYNYSVAKFGFMQFRKIINGALDNELDELMAPLDDAIYSRITDLQRATQPEYVKVLSMFAAMSYQDGDTRTDNLVLGQHYAFVFHNGRDAIEISARMAYLRYRVFCKNSQIAPLFPGHESFLQGLRNCPGLLREGVGTQVQQPATFTIALDALAQLGIDQFKGK